MSNYEVILVDNASSEPGLEEVQVRFPDVKIIRSVTNVGFSKGNNIGIAASNGEYILLLNSDTLLKNDVVTILKNFLDKQPDVAVVAARLEYPSGEVQHNCQRFPSIRYKIFELLRLQKVIPKKASGKILFGPFFDYNESAFPDWVWGTCFMIKRELLNVLPTKKLADELFMYGEDIQWCLDFRKAGYQIGFEPAARVVHLMGKSGGRKTDLMKKSHDYLMKRYYSRGHRKCISILEKWLAWSQR